MKRIKYILCMTIAISTMFISIASGAVFSDVLGHKDVNTTRRHYAALGDDRRRKAATAVRLRETGPETG